MKSCLFQTLPLHMHPIALSVWWMIFFFEVFLNIGVGIKDFAIEGIITEDAFEPLIEVPENEDSLFNLTKKNPSKT